MHAYCSTSLRTPDPPPAQAVPAGLTGLVPAGGQSDWSPEDSYSFNHRVAGKMFVGRLMEHTDNNIMVELVDTSHPTEDHYVHKQFIMVRLGHHSRLKVVLLCQEGRAEASKIG